MLEKLHLAAIEEILDLLDDIPHVAIVNDSKFMKFLKIGFIKGKGSGSSSWTAEFLIPRLKDNVAMDALTFFLSDLRNGLLPDCLKPYFLAGDLLVLAKD